MGGDLDEAGMLVDGPDAAIGAGNVTPLLLRHMPGTEEEDSERLRLLVDGLPEYALYMLDPDGRVESWSLGAERLFGYAAPEIIGRHCSCLYEAADRVRGEPDRTLLTAMESHLEGQSSYRRRDGSSFWGDTVIRSLQPPGAGQRGFAVIVRDVSERQRTEERAHFEANVLSQVDDAVIALDGQQRVTYWNAAAARLFGLTADDVLGVPMYEMVQTNWLRPEDEQAARTALAASGAWHGENVLTTRSGEQLMAESSVRVARDASGAITGMVAVVRDITSRKDLEEQLRRRALYDPLTALPNRALFMDRLSHACAAARRQKHRVGVLFLDLDNFKSVNDRLGHVAGDELLVAVGRRLLENVRESDTAARFGGDEFTVLIEGIQYPADAVRAAERLAAALGHPFRISGQPWQLTASVGIGLNEPARDGCQPERLIREADIALHHAKVAGKARVQLYDRGSTGQASDPFGPPTDPT